MKISIRSYAIVLATALALLCATAQGASALTVHGSVQQVYVLGAHAHQRAALLDRRGHVVNRAAPVRSAASSTGASSPAPDTACDRLVEAPLGRSR